MGCFGHIDPLHGGGINAGIVHTGGDGAGSGVEVLHLLRLAAQPVQILGQGHRVLQGAAGVGTHQIGHHILLLGIAVVQAAVTVHELLIHPDVGLAHIVQHRVDAVLRRHLQLAGDVVLHQLREEFLVLVLQHVVIADAAADKDLLHPRDGPELPQQGEVIAVVGIDILAGGGGQTALVGAHAVFQLLLAGGSAEVGRGAAHVVDIALEIRQFGKSRHLPDDALVAAGGDHAALMEGQGAEVAAAEAAPVVDNGEFHFLQTGHAAHGLIHGVVLPGVGQLRHPIQLFGGQGHGRGIHQQPAFILLLQDGLAPDGVMLGILHPCGIGIVAHAGGHVLKGGDGDAVIGAERGIADHDGSAPDIGHGGDGQLLFQPPGDLNAGGFPHAVNQNIRPGVHQGAAAHLVIPVVVVGEAAERGFQPADDNGQVGKSFPGPVGIDDHRPVRPQAHLLAGGIEVLAAALLGCGVVGHHGIQIAGADHHPQPGPAHGPEGLGIVPVRLGQDGHPEALGLQHPRDHRGAEAGVIHIGVAGDDQKVIPPPAPAFHICLGYRQKVCHIVFVHASNSP